MYLGIWLISGELEMVNLHCQLYWTWNDLEDTSGNVFKGISREVKLRKEDPA